MRTKRLFMFFSKRFFVVYFYVACATMTNFLQGAAAAEKKLDIKRSVFNPVLAGSVAGFSEGFIGLPLSYWKNSLQQGREYSLWPTVWYRGFGVNTFAMVPTTAIQVVGETLLREVLPSEDFVVSIGRSTVAGVLSAVGASTPAEMLILHKQNDGTSFGAVYRKIVNQRGLKALWQGGLPKALRDAGFTVGFLTLHPEVERQARARGVSDEALPFVAGVGAGLPTAMLTHHWDTVSTRMQERFESPMGLLDTMKEIYQKDGASGFFSGFLPRAVRIGAALSVMAAVKKRVEEAL